MNNTKKIFSEMVELTTKIAEDELLINEIEKAADTIINSYNNGNKVIFCGNGGSAAEAQHLAAELSGKFLINRPPIPAEACHTNSSFITAVSNDYDYANTYARYIEGFGNKGDVLVGLSTSGDSKNIINAFNIANKKGLITIAMTGKSGGTLKSITDHIIMIPSENVPRIQEAHLITGHIICEKVEKKLFGNYLNTNEEK